ncbi:MAG: hypothetical protein ACI8Q1_001160 [Parvicella sp.]|jgi:hypothetical protein
MINSIITASVYSGASFLIILTLKFNYELFQKQKVNYLKSLRLLLNFTIILFFCFFAFFSLAIIVRAPYQSSDTIEQNLVNLNNWILIKELWIGLYGLLTITILGIFNYAFRVKFEKLESLEPVFKISLINGFILILSLIVIYFHTYESLYSEIINLDQFHHLKNKLP